MQVKVCPKCATENGQSNAACWKCQAALDGVSLTPSQRGQASQGGYVPPAWQSDARQYGPPPPQPVEKPASPWPMIILFLVVVVAVSAIAFWLKRPTPRPKTPPEQIVLAFLEAKKERNMQKVLPCLCQESAEMVKNAVNNRQLRSAGFEKEEAEDMALFGHPPSSKQLRYATVQAFEVKAADAPKNGAIVHVSVTPLTHKDIFDLQTEVEFVMVIERREWKIDKLQSDRRG